MHFQVPERVGVNGAGEGHGAPSSSAASHPAYHQASLWNSLLPSTGGHIKKSDQRTEPEKKREKEKEREGGRAGGTGGGHYGDITGSSEQVGPTPRRWRRKKDRLEKEGEEEEKGGR